MDSSTFNLHEYHFDVSMTVSHFGGKPFKQGFDRCIDAHSEREAREKLEADLKSDFGMDELPADTVIKRIGWDETSKFKRYKVKANEETIGALTRNLVADLSESVPALVSDSYIPNPQDAI
ncbi:MAG: hypothetical protein M1378_00140 [Bacteroidetes bacterium]|nr:hypothetical protein [Bacteroidota bacterium]